MIEPGREHFLSLTTQLISANKKIRQLTSEERNCLFSLEGNLEFYELYSYDNCVLECKIKITEKKLNCTPWFLPHRSLLGAAWFTLIGRGMSRLGSHWSRDSQFCWRQLSYAIKNQLVASKAPY